VLDRLVDADCWVFDDSVSWKAAPDSAAGFAAKLRAKGIAEILFLASASDEETARLARSLGFDSFKGHCAADDKRAIIAQRQSLGQSVAFFGDCARQTAVAEQANLAIAVLHGARRDVPGAPLALLTPDLARTGVLHRLGQLRRSSVGSAFCTSLIPNVAAMSGAIYLDFSVLSSVLITNLGTVLSYYRWRKTLESVR
jgi:cation transport ATPase